MTLPTDQQEQSVPFCQLKRETPHKRNETDRRSQPGLGINQLTCNAFARNPTTSFNHGLTTAKHHSRIISILSHRTHALSNTVPAVRRFVQRINFP